MLKSSLWTLRVRQSMLSPFLTSRRNLSALAFSFFFMQYIKEYHPLWDFNLHYVPATRRLRKGYCINICTVEPPFDILNFLLLFTVSRDAIKPTQAVCLFFYDDMFFLERFSWSKTLECVSYESSIATSATNLLPLVINMSMTSTPRSLIHSRQTARSAVFFIQGLAIAPSSTPHPSGKGQSYSFLQAE